MNVILYIATSLDGFIADRDGGVGWCRTGIGSGGTAFSLLPQKEDL